MTDRRRNVGQQGEAIARAYLQRKGYTILAANWRCAAGEIDLIVVDRSVVVFVEVRTRRSQGRGSPAESVTPAKQRRLINLAHTYLHQLDEQGTPWHGDWRIDVLALHLSPTGSAHVEHIQHAVHDVA